MRLKGRKGTCVHSGQPIKGTVSLIPCHQRAFPIHYSTLQTFIRNKKLHFVEYELSMFLLVSFPVSPE